MRVSIFLCPRSSSYLFCSFNAPPSPAIYPLSLHDALPICGSCPEIMTTPSPTRSRARPIRPRVSSPPTRSEEHTSELQSRGHLVCRLLLEKKKQLRHVSTLRKKSICHRQARGVTSYARQEQ